MKWRRKTAQQLPNEVLLHEILHYIELTIHDAACNTFVTVMKKRFEDDEVEMG